MRMCWSKQATVKDRRGGVYSTFQFGTYAIRARLPEGRVVIRVLEEGTALRHPNLEGDDDFRHLAEAALERQVRPVVLDDELSPEERLSPAGQRSETR